MVQAPTPRQLQILSMYARGMGRDEIAAELFLSPLTVKIHIEKMRGRLGASTLCQALAVAIVHGFLAVDGRRQELYIPEPLEDKIAV